MDVARSRWASNGTFQRLVCKYANVATGLSSLFERPIHELFVIDNCLTGSNVTSYADGSRLNITLLVIKHVALLPLYR